MPTSSLPIFSKMASPGARVQDPVLCKVKFKWTHLHGQIQMSAAWGKICGQIPERGDNRSHSLIMLFMRRVHCITFKTRKRQICHFLKECQHNFFIVSYSRLSSNGFYFNFRLCESENKYWLEQIKLFPVEVGQVMTDRP